MRSINLLVAVFFLMPGSNPLSVRGDDIQPDRYYYTRDVGAAEVSLTWDSGRGSRCRLAIEDRPNGAVSAAGEVALVTGTSAYRTSLALADLETGRHMVSAYLEDDAGTTLYAMHRVIFKTAVGSTFALPGAPRIDVRGDGIILLNDEPFCPFFASPSDFDSPLAAHSFNVRYGKEALLPRPLERLSVGLPWVTREDGMTFIDMPEEEELLRLVLDEVMAQKSNPLLLCWFLKYEAQIPMLRGESGSGRVRLDNVAELTKIHRFIKAIDPHHLTSVQIDKPFLIEEYKEIADIFEISYGGISSYAQDPIPHLARNVSDLKATLEGRPFFFWLGGSIPNADCRSAENIRGAVYLALMHGAAGIVFNMGHGSIPLSATRHWSVYPGLAAEIEQFFPILASLPRPREYGIRPLEPEIDYCVRTGNGRIYLFAVNTSDNLVQATVQIEDPSIVPDQVDLLFENRTVKFEGNRFTDTFTAYEPHVYAIPLPQE